MGLQIITVTDDGMVNERIHSGDHVLIKKTWPDYRDGDCVAVAFRGLKMVRRISDNHIYIRPDLKVPFNEIELLGKVLRICIEY